jgi:hypothetical protein
MTNTTFRDVVRDRFGGVLRHGKHEPDGQACALEAASVARGLAWCDEPTHAGLPDLRPLNDGPWSSDAARTAALVPVVEALWDWPAWTRAQRNRWAKRVVIETVRQIVAELPGLTSAVRDQCRAADTLPAAAAAGAAWAAAEAEAAGAAAAGAAWAAAEAAREAGSAEDPVLQRACRIWIEAAEAVAGEGVA